MRKYFVITENILTSPTRGFRGGTTHQFQVFVCAKEVAVDGITSEGDCREAIDFIFVDS